MTRMARRLSTLVAAAAVALAGTVAAAPTAEAATYYGAVVYKWTKDGGYTTGRFVNYSSSADLVLDIQKSWPGAGYVTFSSGRCVALAYYEYTTIAGTSKQRGITRATGRSADAASSAAMDEARSSSFNGHVKLLRYQCQG